MKDMYLSRLNKSFQRLSYSVAIDCESRGEIELTGQAGARPKPLSLYLQSDPVGDMPPHWGSPAAGPSFYAVIGRSSNDAGLI